MLTDLHHLALVTEDIDETATEFEDQFGMSCVYRQTTDAWSLESAVYRAGDTILELMEPVGGEGWAHDHLEENGPGFFHLAYEVDDIRAAMAELESRGIGVVDDEPRLSGMNEAWEVVNLDEDDTLVPTQIVQDDRADRFDFSGGYA